jgi:preprotein translocase subunit SecE
MPATADRDGKRQKGKMAKTNPFEFIQQVRAEGAKVTWPTRKETVVTTVMVLIMVTLASVFFFLADQVLQLFVRFVLGIGG